MIARISGELIQRAPDHLIVDVGGLGYRLFVCLNTFYALPEPPAPVELQVHTVVREDAIQLFGFLDSEEREAFEALISMSGFGPRAAVTVLSGIDAREFARAVCSGDLVRLCLIPGVGKKKAERMVLDLKEKLMPLAQPHKGEPESAIANLEDLRSALKNLGFSRLFLVRPHCDPLGNEARRMAVEVPSLLPWEGLRDKAAPGARRKKRISPHTVILLLCLTCAILASSGPAWMHGAGRGGTLLVLFDRSASMNAPQAGISMLRVVCRSRLILRRKPRLILVALIALAYRSPRITSLRTMNSLGRRGMRFQ